MPDPESIGRLGGWEGYEVINVQRFEAGVEGPRPQAWIELEPGPGRRMICEGCGEDVEAIHDVSERWDRDLPVFDAETHLCVQRCRLACPRCGPKLEQLPWLDRYARVTRRLAESVVRLCEVASVKCAGEAARGRWACPRPR